MFLALPCSCTAALLRSHQTSPFRRNLSRFCLWFFSKPWCVEVEKPVAHLVVAAETLANLLARPLKSNYTCLCLKLFRQSKSLEILLFTQSVGLLAPPYPSVWGVQCSGISWGGSPKVILCYWETQLAKDFLWPHTETEVSGRPHYT